MTKRPFEFIELPPVRTQKKPRAKGLTMMIDWGLGLRRLEDTLALCSAYVDLGKIAVGTPRLYDEGVLKEKFAIYKAHQVRPFLGGMFIEHFLEDYGMKQMGRFYEEAKRVGFEVIEVSDNLRPFSSAERRGLIRLARDNGLTVFGEVGSKWQETDAKALIAQTQECLEAGCEIVLVEGAELVEKGRPKRGVLAELSAGLDLDRILFELPGPWISGCNPADVHDLRRLLIAEFGSDVNLANVMPDEVLDTETLRAGLSVVRLKDEARRGTRRATG